MTEPRRTAVIVSASSDIGAAMTRRWLADGWRVLGTYRTASEACRGLAAAGAELVHCDLADRASTGRAISTIQGRCPGGWDALVLCPGTLDPVGLFAETGFDAWQDSVEVNFTAQLRVVHGLLPTRNRAPDRSPLVLFFAGGGTNGAPTRYSAYTVAKIALIKMCELLDAELPDTRFAILGPGWVNTKIHSQTLAAGAAAGVGYERTRQVLATGSCTPVDEVLDCCDWLLGAPRDIIGGRNFSVVHDRWGDAGLAVELSRDPDLYKLRRAGNDRFPRRTTEGS